MALEIPMSDVLFKPLWAAYEPINVLEFTHFHRHQHVLDLKFTWWFSQILDKVLMPAPGTTTLEFIRGEYYGYRQRGLL